MKAITRMARPCRHIAIYLPSLRGGGAERVMVMLANEFVRRGHSVDLVLVKAEGPYRAEVSNHVNVIDLDRRRVLSSLPPLLTYLRRRRPDAMLSALIHANVVAILARGLAGVTTRLIVSERNSLSGLKGVRGALLRLMVRLFYPWADGVVAVSRGIKGELVEIGVPNQRITAIPNPLDVNRIGVLAAERPRHAWLAHDAPPVILAVGRLEAQKDYPTLLSAFVRVRANREARLVILGEGSLRTHLQQQISDAGLEDSVLLAGFQTNPYGWMAAAKVYVLSSRHEGFPNSLIQAMACGVHVISTDCPTGPNEILEGGRWGKLVPVGNVAELAKAMIEGLDALSPPNSHDRLQSFLPNVITNSYERVLI